MAVAKATTLPHTGGSLSPTTPHVASRPDPSRRGGDVPCARARRLLAGTPGYLPSAVRADGDYVLSAWFIGWVPHAIAHGLNPFFTNSMFVPTGVNLAQILKALSSG